MKRFVHLHNHTEYSLLDGACRISDEKGKPGELIKTAAAFHMPALAITDHGNMYGAIEFYKNCNASGIKPIIGCEVYVALGSRFDKKTKENSEANYYHLVLLAKDETGYKNLMKLSSLGFIEGFYYKPRIDKELLRRHGDGIIAMSACLKGEIPRALLDSGQPAGQRVLDEYLDIFGRENFYLELMDNGLDDQRKVNPMLIELGRKSGVKIVATNDCHYIRKEDSESHDALLCIGTGRLIKDENRLRFSSSEFYFRSPEEMSKIFEAAPEALENTVEIADRCSLDISFNQFYLPHFETPPEYNADSYLEKLAYEGMVRRYGSIIPDHKKRLDYELSVIKKMEFSSYFLIVWDFIRYARERGIMVGPGRGSGAGSLVAYCLHITNICPLQNGLLFERFLNPDRKSMPDLDIDFLDERREEVIEYVRDKYGSENVARIITFGALMAKLVVRDVGRVMDIPLNEVDQIAKLIPRDAGSVQNALKIVPELKKLYKSDNRVKKLFDIASRLEGLKRHTGVHAAGIVITKDKITEYSPLAKSARDVVTSQYNDESLLSLGLLKVDFLGLSTLTVIDRAIKEIRKRHNPDFEINSISLDDAPTYKLLSSAQALGVFQLDSEGMRDLLRKIKPSRLGDIVALISLYRPGPMGAGMLDEFVARKHARVKVTYEHPLLEPILEDTLGVIIYQEQVMRIAVDLAGFTPGQADVLRKAMGKKIPEEIEKQRSSFIEGARSNGIDKSLAVKIFEQMAHFGGYGFNKSHASAYALISYRCAYLKANYPVDYMCALLSSEIGSNASKEGKESDLVIFLREAENMDIPILQPDINNSNHDFSIEHYAGESKNAIRFGLMAVKNVGGAAVDAVIEERTRGGRFDSFEDFCKRIDQSKVNRKVIESLIKAGAMDCFGGEPNVARPGFLGRMESILAKAQGIREDYSIGQGNLFGFEEMTASSGSADSGRDEIWSDHDRLTAEKDVLGLYFSGHPLTKYSKELANYSQATLAEIKNGRKYSGDGSTDIAGMITNVRKLFTKEKKEPYARFRLEDLSDDIECIVFPRGYAKKLAQYIEPNKVVIVKGKLNSRDENSREFLVDDIIPLEDARRLLISRVIISVNTAGLDDYLLGELERAFNEHPGNARVEFHLINEVAERIVVLETTAKVSPSEEFQSAIENLLGKESWKIMI